MGVDSLFSQKSRPTLSLSRKKKTSGDETEQVFMIGSEVIDQARTRRSRRAGCRWLELKPELIDKQYT